MFWAQGGELVDAAGDPIFGESPNRERMVRVMRFLRDTIETGASPRSVLANNDYQQLSSAAVAGDVAMFLGGKLAAARARDRAVAGGVREVADCRHPAGGSRTARDRHRRLGLGDVRARRGTPARRDRVPAIRRVAGQRRRASSCPHGQLPVRRSIYRDFPFFREDPWYAKFGEMLVDGRARPAVPIYPAISEQLQLAVGAVVSGDKTPEAAVDDAWRTVQTIAARQRSRDRGNVRGPDPVKLVPPLVTALIAVALLVSIGRRRGSLPRGSLPRSAS